MRERLAGYRAALRAAGLEEDPVLVVSGNHDALAAQAAVARLLALPDDAPPDRDLRLQQPQHGRRAARARRARAARSRWSASTTSSSPTCSAPPSCAPTPGASASRRAALAFARLDGDDRPPLEITVPTELIVRGSGEVAP